MSGDTDAVPNQVEEELVSELPAWPVDSENPEDMPDDAEKHALENALLLKENDVCGCILVNLFATRTHRLRLHTPRTHSKWRARGCHPVADFV